MKSFQPSDVYKLWNKFSKLPGGKFLFHKILFRTIPYSGSISAEIIELFPGRAKIRIKEHRAIRNHLSSIHAVALMNVCELTSGLAFVSQLPPEMRAILTHFEIEFLKKSRGEIVTETEAPAIKEGVEDYTVEVFAKNHLGETVCKARAKWKAGIATGKKK